MPPSQQDVDNLITSGVERVLLGYALASTKPDVLARLVGLNKRICIRLEESQETPASIAHTLSDIRHIIPVDAVLLPTEPDAGCDMRYGAPSWGQQIAYASLPRVVALIDAIQGLGLKAVSPAMTWPPDVISEDGTPQPGRVTWREIVGPTYDRADGVASHCGYVLGWDSNPVNRWRFKMGLKRALEEWHQELWIDECTFPTDNDVLQMQSALDMADIIMSQRGGERVRMICPFTSGGSPGGAWDARFLLKDPAAYLLLRNWLAG